MIARTSSTTTRVSFGNCEHDLTVDVWTCPLCGQQKVSVYVDGGIEYGGEFFRGDGLAGCMDCWPNACL